MGKRRASRKLHTRRLDPAESRFLREFEQAQQDLWRRYFPDHDTWLDQVVHAVSRGERIAFGCFDPVQVNSPCVGTVVVKRDGLTDVLDVKNLVVQNERVAATFASGKAAPSPPDIRSSLLRAVEQFGARRGLHRMHISCPSEDQEFLGHLFARGFAVVSISDFLPRLRLYHLARAIPDSFIGDPHYYHDVAALRWYLRSAYGIESAIKAKQAAGDGEEKPRTFRRLPIWINGSTPQLPQLKGHCVIRAGQGTRDQFRNVMEEERRTQQLSFFYDPEAKPSGLAPETGSPAGDFYQEIRYTQIMAHSGEDSTLRRDPFGVEELGGMCLDLTDPYMSRIRERAGSMPFVFFVKNGIGEVLMHLDSKGIALFYSPAFERDETGFPIIRIWGLSIIDETIRRTIKDAFDFARDFHCLWSPREYQMHIRRTHVDVNHDGKIVLLTLQPPLIFDKPFILDRSIASKKLSKYIDDEYGTSSLSTFYIDAQTIKNILTVSNTMLPKYDRDAEAKLPVVRSAVAHGLRALQIADTETMAALADASSERRSASLFTLHKLSETITIAQSELIHDRARQLRELSIEKRYSGIEIDEKRRQLALELLALVENTVYFAEPNEQQMRSKVIAQLNGILGQSAILHG